VASKTDPRRIVLLVVLLVTLAVVAMVRLRPALTSGGAPAASVAQVSNYRVPTVQEAVAGSAGAETQARRNLFTFGAPPTPTPDRRPTATPAPTLPPRPIPTPTPPGIMTSRGRMPDPPNFTATFLGWLGPERLLVGVFRDGDEIVAVPVGGTIKDKFILREVGPTAAVIGFVGYPDDVKRQVPLAK
jgi:hypothetical protein